MLKTVARTDQKFIVIPFRRGPRNRIIMGEMRPVSSASAAERIAAAMSSRYAGVLAYEVTVDNQTGEMTEPRLLYRSGETIDVMEEA